MTDLEAEQRALEAECVEIGAARYWAALDPADDKATPGLLRFSGASELIAVIGHNLAALLQARVKALPAKPNPEDPTPLLVALPAPVWSAIVINTVFSVPELLHGQPLVASALELVRRAVQEADARIWTAQNADAKRRVQFISKTRTDRSYGRRVVEAMRSADAESYRDLWHPRMRLKLGALLLADLVAGSDGALELQQRWERGRRQWILTLTPKGADCVAEVANSEALSRPARLPMVVPPKDWVRTEEQ